MFTGTDSFDSHDDPGCDSSPNNDIVRSNDQILYRLGFLNTNTVTKRFTQVSAIVSLALCLTRLPSD